MKERIVIEDFNCPDNCKRKDCEVCFNERSKKEQVPETFTDLLTLCKNTKGCFVLRISNGEYIEVPTDLIGYSFTFHENGNIFFYEDICVLEKATPARQWQIIKSLIGAE